MQSRASDNSCAIEFATTTPPFANPMTIADECSYGERRLANNFPTATLSKNGIIPHIIHVIGTRILNNLSLPRVYVFISSLPTVVRPDFQRRELCTSLPGTPS